MLPRTQSVPCKGDSVMRAREAKCPRHESGRVRLAASPGPLEAGVLGLNPCSTAA